MVWWMECRGGDIKEGGKTQTKALRLFLDSDPVNLISNFRLQHLHLKIAQIACGEAAAHPAGPAPTMATSHSIIFYSQES